MDRAKETEKKQKSLIPPNSKESEMMVLGCMLTSIDSLNAAADLLNPNDFYYSEHQQIYRVLYSAYQNDKPADIHLICEELKRQNQLDAVGGVAYVTSLAQYAGTSAHIERYAEIVSEKAILRKIIATCRETEKEAVEEPEDVYDALDRAQQKLFVIGQSTNKQMGVTISELLSGEKSSAQLPFIKQLEQRQEEYLAKGEDEACVIGQPTHFLDLDKTINGLNPSHLVILAARPAMGKTALALNIAENVCFKNNAAVGVFSLEMTAEQLLQRMISSQSGVEGEKIKTGALSGEEFQRVVSATGAMQKGTMIIDDQPGLKITDLRARARRMKESYNIELLVIDYLQLLSGSGFSRSSDNRQNEISEISRMLKNLARELDIPVLCLSQLSRKVEERTGHRPMMSDLRESGSIEQDADVILFLLRREYYDPYDKPGTGELIVAKNRHGSVGSVNLTFRKEIAQFANYIPLRSGNEEESGDDAFAAFSPS